MDTIEIALNAALVILIGLIAAAIFGLRRKHSREIYLIWYVFSFSFLLFGSLQYVATTKKLQLAQVFGPTAQGWFEIIYRTLTEPDDEFIFVIAMLGLGIGPQLLTYFLSGLSGSASAPKFVWQVEQFAIWSLIKFFAALAGISLSEVVGKIAAGGTSYSIRGSLFGQFGSTKFDWADILLPAVSLFVTFGLAWAQLVISELNWKRPVFRPPVKAFNRLHRIFTRHSISEDTESRDNGSSDARSPPQ
jgi:hypothetical protein